MRITLLILLLISGIFSVSSQVNSPSNPIDIVASRFGSGFSTQKRITRDMISKEQVDMFLQRQEEKLTMMSESAGMKRQGRSLMSNTIDSDVIEIAPGETANLGYLDYDTRTKIKTYAAPNMETIFSFDNSRFAEIYFEVPADAEVEILSKEGDRSYNYGFMFQSKANRNKVATYTSMDDELIQFYDGYWDIFPLSNYSPERLENGYVWTHIGCIGAENGIRYFCLMFFGNNEDIEGAPLPLNFRIIVNSGYFDPYEELEMDPDPEDTENPGDGGDDGGEDGDGEDGEKEEDSDIIKYTYDNAGNVTGRKIIILEKIVRSDTNPRSLVNQKIEKMEDELLNLKIYPNPTTGTLYVEIPDYKSDEQVFMSLYDLYGRLYKQEYLRSSHNIYDISSYKNGVYILHIKRNNKVSSWKVIKK